MIADNKLFSNTRTLIMGILNVTPDSFFDGGIYYQNMKKSLQHVSAMIEEGADIVDIGGESTRPYADSVSQQEEMKRVLPVIKSIRKHLGDKPVISIDTYKAEVARQAIIQGANIINDVSGLQDQKMPSVAASYGVPIVVNHMRGKPKTMQKNIIYADVISTIKAFFVEKIKILENAGVSKKKIILDPGFGFGKTVDHNIELVRRLREFSSFHLPILIGVSRKSSLGIMLEKKLGKKTDAKDSERLFASLAATAVAVYNGAHIIRTHDVLQTKQFLTIFDTIRTSSY